MVQQAGPLATGDGAAGRTTGYRWWCSRQGHRLQVKVQQAGPPATSDGAAGGATGYRWRCS